MVAVGVAVCALIGRATPIMAIEIRQNIVRAIKTRRMVIPLPF
jgi:hypothetical protein